MVVSTTPGVSLYWMELLNTGGKYCYPVGIFSDVILVSITMVAKKS